MILHRIHYIYPIVAILLAGFLKTFGQPGFHDADAPANQIQVDHLKHQVIIPCSINKTKGVMEYLLCYGNFKDHETFLTTRINPLLLQLTLYGLGYSPVSTYKMTDDQLRTRIEAKNRKLQQLSISLAWHDSTGRHEVSLQSCLTEISTGRVPDCNSWYFNGLPEKVDSLLSRLVPVISNTHYHYTCSVIEMNSTLLFRDDAITINTGVSPPPGTNVQLIIGPYSNVKNHRP